MKTRQYTEKIDYEFGDVMTLKEWISTIQEGCIINTDGCGYWAKDGYMSRDEVFNSPPLDATHVVWFNK